MARLAKTKQRRIQDFKHYTELLSNDIQNVKKGKLAHYRTMLATLRTLVCPGRGNDLLREISEITQHPVELEVWFLSKCEPQSLDEYISGDGPFIKGKQYTRAEYIYELASQDGSHSDKDMDEELVEGEKLWLGGVPANVRQILAYAETVLETCKRQLTKITF